MINGGSRLGSSLEPSASFCLASSTCLLPGPWQRIIEPDPVFLLEIANLPCARGLAGAWVRIQRPTDRRRKKEIARRAIGADRTDVIGLLPLSADDQRHFVFLALLGRARIP